MTYISAKAVAGDDGSRQETHSGRNVVSVVTENNPQRQILIAALSGSDTCAAAGVTVKAYTPILVLCRELIKAGLSPDDALEVRRNGQVALNVRTLCDGARLEIGENGFVPYRARRRP